MLASNALYPGVANVGKDKHGLSIGISICSAKFKHEGDAIMQHQPVFKLHPVRLPVKPPLGPYTYRTGWQACVCMLFTQRFVSTCVSGVM